MREHRSGRGAWCGFGGTIVTLLGAALVACGGPGNGDGGADGSDGSRTDGGACGAGIGECNPVANTGCDGGMACSFGLNMAGMPNAICAPPGDGTYGMMCASPADCAAGFTCIGGACTKLCCAAGDDAPCQSGPGAVADARCMLGINGSSLMACVAPMHCDWFAQDCPNGGNCMPLSGGATSCQPAGMATEGQPCGGSTGMNCARGLVCINVMGGDGAHCRQVCNPRLMGTGGGGGGDAGSEAGADDAGSDAADDAASEGGAGDAGIDAGGLDAGGIDAGGADAGGVDASGADASGTDAGAADASRPDAPASDAPTSDAPTSDAPASDARADGGGNPMRCPAGFMCNGIMGAPSNYGACIPTM